MRTWRVFAEQVTYIIPHYTHTYIHKQTDRQRETDTDTHIQDAQIQTHTYTYRLVAQNTMNKLFESHKLEGVKAEDTTLQQ